MKRTLVAVAVALFANGFASAKETPDTNMTGSREQAMANCPSAVVGSTTRLSNRADGVELTVVAADARAQQEIRRRARRQEAVSAQSARGALEHTGQGTGSGRFGFCPGMSQGTTVRAEALSKGARIKVQASDPSTVRQLHQETAKRLDALRDTMQ
jgi:TusA-related sulfurtransferase